MLGHELRNPLSPIVTALQLMRVRGEDAHAREREIIQRQVEHLVRLVDDLLDISRVTRGKIVLRIERAALAQVLGKAVEMASPLLEQRSHHFESEVEAGLWCDCDPVRVAQVVSNLLTNAARYTEPGGRVRLRARRIEAGEVEMVEISVADNGIGMAPALRAQVFGLFFQGKRGVDRAEGGLGIGLALVKNIVELHGGTVEARSEGLGKGSEFIVRLPLGRDGQQANAPAAGLAQGAAPAAPRAGRRRQRRRRRDAGQAARRAGTHGRGLPRSGGGAGRGGAPAARGGAARHRPAGAGRLPARRAHPRAA
jgi:signal transduction histidine kinase